MMIIKTLFLTNKSSHWQTSIQELRRILKGYGHKIKEVDDVMTVREILHQSEENIIVFSFCSTQSEKKRIMKVLEKEIYPIIIIMPYENDPTYPILQCHARIYTTLSILPAITEVMVV